MRFNYPTIIAIFISFLIIPNYSIANTTTTIQDVTIIVMPEYNQHPKTDNSDPNVLIGYHGTIVNQSNQSIEEGFSIHVPLQDPDFWISLAAHVVSDIEMEEVELKIDEKKQQVIIIPNEPIKPGDSFKFVIEYYYNPIRIENKKTFTYQYEAVSNHDIVNIIVFEPFKSKGFSVTPSTDKQGKDSMGINMHLYQYKDVKKGDRSVFDVSYEKDNQVTTKDHLEQYVSTSSENSPHVDKGPVKILGLNIEMFASLLLSFVVLIAIVAILFFKMRKPRDVNDEHNLDQRELRKLYTDGKIDRKTYLKNVGKG